MGLWSKVKGVFGRIGNGLKKGWNWITSHKENIDKALDTTRKFIPSQYTDKFDKYREKGNEIYGHLT